MNEIALQAIPMILLANVVRQMELSLNPWYSYPPVKEPNKSFCKEEANLRSCVIHCPMASHNARRCLMELLPRPIAKQCSPRKTFSAILFPF